MEGNRYNYSLKEVLLGVVNLSVNDGNKQILYNIGMIPVLKSILEIDPSKTKLAQVLLDLEESKAWAAQVYY